jgi:hypothetical protein
MPVIAPQVMVHIGPPSRLGFSSSSVAQVDVTAPTTVARSVRSADRRGPLSRIRPSYLVTSDQKEPLIAAGFLSTCVGALGPLSGVGFPPSGGIRHSVATPALGFD